MDNSFRCLIFFPYCPFGLYGDITPFRLFLRFFILYQQGAICVNKIQDGSFQLSLLNLDFLTDDRSRFQLLEYGFLPRTREFSVREMKNFDRSQDYPPPIFYEEPVPSGPNAGHYLSKAEFEPES